MTNGPPHAGSHSLAPAGSSSLHPVCMLDAVLALWGREVRTFLRDRARIAGALAQPLAFWALLGFGFGPSFRAPEGASAGVGYGTFLFPGMIALVVVFTAIFSTIYVVEQRRTGFLQGVLVAPVPRLAIALGSALGGATLALAQAVLFGAAIPLLGLAPGAGGIALALAHVLLLGLAFTALGFVLAWRVETTRAYHGLMTALLMPLWALSGAVFPVDGLPAALGWLVRANPVTYAVEGLRGALLGASTVAPAAALALSAAFCAAMLALAARTARRSPG